MQPQDEVITSQRSVRSAFSSTLGDGTSNMKESHTELLDHTPLLWSRIRHQMMPYFSEFLGTFVFLLFSFGVTAQVVLSESKKGDYTTLCLGWGCVTSLSSYLHCPVTNSFQCRYNARSLHGRTIWWSPEPSGHFVHVHLQKIPLA
jgi:hypothetical protein